MPKMLFSICSQTAIVDQLTNNLSIINIIEQINASVLPLRVPQLFLSSLWESDPEDINHVFECKIRLLDPTGNQIQTWNANWTFAKTRHRHILAATNIEFSKIGNYCFEISIKRKDIKAWSKPAGMVLLPVVKPESRPEN